MKHFLQSVALALFATLSLAAQEAGIPDNPGWLHTTTLTPEEVAARITTVNDRDRTAMELESSTELENMPQPAPENSGAPPTPTAGGNEADEISPEISELARGLHYNPLAIYEYVRNHIEFEAYYGSKKGARLTLLEGSGNDFDQAALLVALMRASGLNPVYKYGACDFTYGELVQWVGLSPTPYSNLSDAQFTGKYPGVAATATNRKMVAAIEYLTGCGYYIVEPSLYGGDVLITIPHVWVEMTISGTARMMSPSYKFHEDFAGIDLATATGYLRSQLLSDAAGTVSSSPDSVTNLSYSGVSSRLGEYAQNLRSWLKDNEHELEADLVPGARRILAKNYQSIDEVDLFFPWVGCPWLSITTWSAIPTTEMSKLRIQCGTYNYTAATPAFTTTLFNQVVTMPSLKGRKISLSWAGNTASIRLDETLLGSAFTVTGSTVDIQLKASHNHYIKDPATYANSSLGRNDQQETKRYLKGDGYAYAFVYSFSNSEKLSRDRQDILGAYRRNNLLESDWRIRTEVLNIMGLEWYHQTWKQGLITAPVFNTLPLMHHRFGRVAQEQSFYIDVGLQASAEGNRNRDAVLEKKAFQFGGLVSSAMEHGIIEQMQGEDKEATSTVKMVYLANQQGVPIYRAKASNWTSVRSQLVNYSGQATPAGQLVAGVQYRIVSSGTTNFTTIGAANNLVGTVFTATGTGTGTGTATPTGADELAEVQAAVNSSGDPGIVLIHRNGRISINNWRGHGYALERPSNSLMKISGGLFGGYNSQTGSVSSSPVAAWTSSNPGYNSSGSTYQNVPYTPYTTPRPHSSDPVELLSGAFVLDKTELTLGSGSAPRGLAFSRHYNSARRYDKTPGIGYGWTHNYDIFLTKRTSVTASMAGTISYHCAPFIAAMQAAADLHLNHANTKEWATAALAVNWAVDQITYNAVAVTMGNRTIEFIRMPDGSYEAPAGMNLTLVSHGSGASEYFTMTERHGSTHTFNTSGQIATITDLWGQPQTFTYTAGLLTGVSDSYGRTLTFTRPSGRITSIADSAGRSISFGYNGDDLASCTDVENKTWSYIYDNHRITESRDPSNRLIATNVYDSMSRVMEQRTFGDNDKLHTFRYSGYWNSEEYPDGGIASYLYDKRGRSFATIDPLGNRTDFYYDGHDRKIGTLSPAEEWTYFYHDKNNNTTTVTDAIDLSEERVYDGQQRLETFTDKRDNVTTVNTYNAYYQPLLITAPLNRTTTTTYTATGETDTVTDAEDNVTDYDYNSLGQLWKVHINNHLKVTYTYNSYGDVETETDALQRVTSHTYNKRRQLRTTTLPAVPGEPTAVFEITYDDEGLPKDIIDARLKTKSHTYSPTGDLLTTTLPAIPVAGGSGLNNVLSTIYNSRNLPDTTSDSLVPTTATLIHDAAGRLSDSYDSLSRHTGIGYDANSRPNSRTNGLDYPTTFNYTPRGEPWNTWDALDKNTRQTYDANGNPWQRRNRRGHTHTTIYDEANRLHTSATPLTHTTTTDYYDNDLVHVITEPSTQATTLTYDDHVRLWTKADAVGTVTYGYTNADELWTVTEGSDTITRTYDERGRLKTFTTADGDLIQYRYDANNNLSRITYPPDTAHPTGKQVNYTYNARNLLETVTDWSDRLTTYHYDRLGRLTGIVRPNGTNAGFGYDSAAQLQWMRETKGGKLFSYVGFKYDDAGQIKNRFRAPLVNSGWDHPSFSATYDNDNRLETVNGQSVTHDDDGNMTYGPIRADSGLLNLGYNARNQLTSADGISYTYDSEGRRRTLTDTTGSTRDVIDSAGRLLVRHHPDTSKTYYVYGLGLLYEADESDATKTYHFDQVGSTLVRTDDTGNVIGRAEYSAFGLITYKQGDMATPFLYNGQAGVQTDPNGLLNMRARYYSPYLMRFLNADPIGFSGGSNWFAYADGNPISLNDPFGLCANYVSPYDADGTLNWTGIGNYLYDAVTEVPGWIAKNGWTNFNQHLSDPTFVATSALGGMGMGGITGGLKSAAKGSGQLVQTEFAFARGASIQTPGVTQAGETFVRVGATEASTGVRAGSYAMPEATFNALGRDPAVLKNALDLPGSAPQYFRYIRPPAGTPIQRGIVPGGEFGGVGGHPEVIFPKGIN